MPLFALSLLTILFAPPLQSISKVPPGFRIVVDMKEDISSAKAKPGDTVKLICMDSIQAQSGTVYIPLGAQLSGKVVAVQKHGKGQQARLSLRVDRAKWNGGEAELDAFVVTIVSVAKTQYVNTRLADATIPNRNADPSDINARANTQSNYDIRTPTGTIKGRDKSEGEKQLGGMSKPASSATTMVMGDVPESWGLEKVDDPAIGSAITADDGDVVLTKGSRLVLKTR